MFSYVLRRMVFPVVAFCAVTTAQAEPISTAITYQGALQEAGSPANGSYDFRFILFSGAAGGSQVGSPVAVENLGVSEGVFTVLLDFGQYVFDAEGRWLEIGVRPGSDSDPAPYTILTPRQQITAAPVSHFSLESGDNRWSQIGDAITNNNTGFVGINRSARVNENEYFGVQVPVTSGYGGMYIQAAGPQAKPFYGFKAGSRFAWTVLDGNNGNWILNNSGDHVFVTSLGKVGIGTATPEGRLDVLSSDLVAVNAFTDALASVGVSGTGNGAGVRGTSTISNGIGVLGRNNHTTGTGVRGESSGASGVGVNGYCSQGQGVHGRTDSGYGIYGTNSGSNVNGYAGYFNGRVHVAGTLSKASGSFKIDHPQDPRNKTLSHSFVESPDMMNVYNGNITTDTEGIARVELPGYFEALNSDFRYQLTVLGEFAQAVVAEEVADNAFVIRTDKPGVRVSWQVTGIRQDPYALANRIVVEEDKPASERGRYLNPGAYGTAGNELAAPGPDELTAEAGHDLPTPAGDEPPASPSESGDAGVSAGGEAR